MVRSEQNIRSMALEDWECDNSCNLFFLFILFLYYYDFDDYIKVFHDYKSLKNDLILNTT